MSTFSIVLLVAVGFLAGGLAVALTINMAARHIMRNRK